MELSLDTASDLASIALSRDGEIVAERAWQCRRNHTVELLPAIDRLLAESRVAKSDLTAVFVSTGPGMYTGLRVSIAIAKGLARALGLPMAGVGRLELDAHPHRGFPGQIVAVHRAGRGDIAWAAYADEPWRELSPPRLSRPEEMVAAIAGPTLVTGELDDALREMVGDRAECAAPEERGRAPALAILGHARLAAGLAEEPALLKPIYLRPPAIGPHSV